MNIKKQLTAIVCGAGCRGTTYAKYMKTLSDKYAVVGVAEPIATRRNNLQRMFNIPNENCFADYREILAKPKMADIAVIATQDNMHVEPALMAIEKGYHLLLEKPVAPTPEECVRIAQAAKEKGVKVLVCHVLRYTPFYKTIKKAVMDGLIGDIVSVMAVEGVGNTHQSHSYVRGDWKSERTSSPMLLAKCCHDLDIIQWIVDKPCQKVSSFGELTYFKPENAPKGAPKRCYNTNCPDRKTCPYDVNKVYLSEHAPGFMRLAAARGYSDGFDPNDDEVRLGLEGTGFGDCVFFAGNDVVDHQIVNMQFADGVTASLTMNAFNEGGRYIRLFGTRGELYADHKCSEITVFTFEDRKRKTIPVIKTDESIAGGHGGGDGGMIDEMYTYFTDEYSGFCAANIDVSVKNHLIGFATEKARNNDTVECVQEFAAHYGFVY